MLKALESPIRQIAENSGVEGSIVVGNVLANKSQTYGSTPRPSNMSTCSSAGIVDPAKVVRVALQDAASIAGLMITTEAMVAEAPKKNAPAMPGGGMGGMDYWSPDKTKTGRDPVHDLPRHVRRGGILPPRLGRRVLCNPWLGIRENR